MRPDARMHDIYGPGALTAGVTPASAVAICVVLAVAAAGTHSQDTVLDYLAHETPALDWPESPAGPSAAEQEAWVRVEAFIRSEVLQNCQPHPAEGVFEAFLRRFGDASLFSLTQHLRDSVPDLFATTLRLVGRLSQIGDATRKSLVVHGLASHDSDVRDAAMQAVETAEARALIPVLAAHVEPIPWLADYKNGIIADLSG